MKPISYLTVSLILAIALGYRMNEPVNASIHKEEQTDSTTQRGFHPSSQTQKPIILLVPGFSTTEVLTRGRQRNPLKHQCSEQAIPIAEYPNGYFEELPGWVQEEGFEVRVALIESNYERTPSILDNAECLRKQIVQAAQESPTRDVAIIAHSMGGLVTRAYVQSEKLIADRALYGMPLVRKIFLAGSPNLGIPIHFWFNLLLDCESPQTNQKAACEFTSDEWMADFNAKYNNAPEDLDIYAVGGTYFRGRFGYLIGCYLCLMRGPNDGAVPAESAIGVGKSAARVIFNETHQMGIGAPSYFTGVNGAKSQFYSSCVYPVLVTGDRNGCTSTIKPTCAPAIPALIVPAGIILLLAVRILGKRRYRGTK